MQQQQNRSGQKRKFKSFFFSFYSFVFGAIIKKNSLKRKLNLISFLLPLWYSVFEGERVHRQTNTHTKLTIQPGAYLQNIISEFYCAATEWNSPGAFFLLWKYFFLFENQCMCLHDSGDDYTDQWNLNWMACSASLPCQSVLLTPRQIKLNIPLCWAVKPSPVRGWLWIEIHTTLWVQMHHKA